MRKKKVSEVFDYLDEKYIEEVALYKSEAKAHRRFRGWKWVGMAACLTVVVLVGSIWVPKILEESNSSKKEDDWVTLAEMNRPYKELKIYTDTREISIVWPSEYLSLASKCGDMEFEGRTYVRSFGLPDKSMIGEMIGSAESNIYEGLFENRHIVDTQIFDAYKLKGIEEENFIVVKIEDEAFLYQNEEYDFPATFGELIKVYNLTENLEFDCFRVYQKDIEKGHFSLEEDDFIWKILSKCKNVAFMDGTEWERENRNYLSFTVTSKEIGVGNKVFYVTEDGYIWTNMFEFGMLFEIGEEFANQIISYAMKYGVETKEAPKRLEGTIAEFGDDYILVSDAILCENPEDGITFKVSMSTLAVRFYEEHMKMKVGDLVSVEYKYGIDTVAGNEVTGVVEIEEAYLKEN